MDRELKNLTLNISQLAALSGVHRQTAAARLQNLPVAGGMKATSSFIGWLILCRHFWHCHRRLQKAKWTRMSAKPGISLNVSVLSSNRKRHNSFRPQ